MIIIIMIIKPSNVMDEITLVKTITTTSGNFTVVSNHFLYTVFSPLTPSIIMIIIHINVRYFSQNWVSCRSDVINNSFIIINNFDKQKHNKEEIKEKLNNTEE